MTRSVTALCNECGKITDVVFKQKHHPNKIQETYFKCEHCFYHYTSFVTDTKVRKLHRKRDNTKGIYNAEKRLEIQEEINSRMFRLKDNLIRFGRADL